MSGIFLMLPVLLISVIIHEVAHGYAAYKLGDPTAQRLGRLTLNPLPHIDPFMTIILPLILIFSGSSIIFGGAKPVPVNPFNLRNPKRDMAIISFAGPFSNFILGIFFTIIAVKLSSGIGGNDVLFKMFLKGSTLNFLLMGFNLFPVPPLDGSKIVALFLPDHFAERYLGLSTFGFLIIFGIFYLDQYVPVLRFWMTPFWIMMEFFLRLFSGI